MRILIIEDEIIIARFIEQQLKLHFLCSTAIALNQEEVMATMPGLLPHLIVCDINLKEEKDGVALVDDLRQEYAFEVIFVTSYQSKAIIEKALQYQPLNYIIKPADEATLFAAFKLAWPLIEGNDKLGKLQETARLHPLLNPAEQRIIQLILQNKTSREIASILFLSPYTIKNYRHNICRKLGLNSGNNSLLQWALQHKELLG